MEKENKAYSYTFSLNLSGINEKKLDRLFLCCYDAYRDCVMYYRKRLNCYYNDRRYKEYISNRYNKALEFATYELGEAPIDENEKKKYDKQVTAKISEWYKVNKITQEEKELLNSLQKEYDLITGSFGSNTLRKNILNQYKEYINDDIASYIVKSVSSGVKKVLFSNGETIKLKPYRDFTSICLVRNRSGYIQENNGKLTLQYKQARRRGKVRLEDIEIITKDVPEEIQNAIYHDEIKYGTIKRLQTIKGWKYQIQILFAGVPKRNNLEAKSGIVGVDVTERHIAIATDDGIFYYETPCKSLEIIEKINDVQRDMDKQLRDDNPEHFNTDGTFKRGVKGKLNKTYKYRKLRRKLSVLYRKNNNILEYQQNKLANEIVSMGSVINIVQKDWQEKVKRATETTFTDTGAYEDKSSLSEESVRQTAPAQLIEKIKQRAEYIGAEVNKVSNKELEIYCIDIFTGESMPYTIDDEYYIVAGEKVQRTVYYAFMMSGYDPVNKNIDFDLLTNKWNKILDYNKDRQEQSL